MTNTAVTMTPAGPTAKQSMKAALIDELGAPDVFRIGEAPLPIAVNAEVIVKVHAAGINPIDAKTRAGRGASAAIPSFPYILGYDFSGVVAQAPYESSPFPVGTEVYGMSAAPRNGGSYAEYVSVPISQLARKPRTLSHVEAAAVPVAALTAWGMVVETAKAREGQRILIHAGSGGVGHFAVQFASYFGATVIATTSTPNVSFVKSLGAREVIDYSKQRFEEAISQQVDVVIDLVGNVHDNTGTRSLDVLRPGGLLVNAPSGSWPTVVEDSAEQGVRATRYKVSPEGSTLSVLTRLLDAGDLLVSVADEFALSDIAAAHRLLEEGHVRGKLVLRVV